MWKIRENVYSEWNTTNNKEGTIYYFCNSKFHVYSNNSKSLKKLQILISPKDITVWKNGEWVRKYV